MGHLYFTLMLSFLLLACGRDKGSSSGKKTVPLQPEEIENILDRQVFSCFSDGECPPGIARLFIINPDNTATSSVCTGFMISSNRLMTNNHCVSSERSCRNTFISILTNQGPVKSRCLKIEFTEADSEVASERSTDLTVMTIEGSVPSPYFRIHDKKVEPGLGVSAWAIDHVSVLQARVIELNCFYESLEASMLLRRCPAISGNSGSPVVLKGTREVIGILWGSNIPPTIDASFPLNLRMGLEAISLATELFPFRPVINVSGSSPR